MPPPRPNPHNVKNSQILSSIRRQPMQRSIPTIRVNGEAVANNNPATVNIINDPQNNLATTFSRDKKRMLKLTIVQRRSSLEDVPSPSAPSATSSLESTSSSSSTASSTSPYSSRDSSPSEDTVQQQIIVSAAENTNNAPQQPIQVNTIPEAQLKEISNLLQAKTNYQLQQQQIQAQPPVAQQQPEIEEVATSWGIFQVQKSGPNAPTFVAGEQKAAYDLKTRQHVTMQIINKEDLNIYRKLRNRLDMEGWKLWAPYDSPSLPTYDELRNMVLHKEAKIVKDTRTTNGEVYYFIEPKNLGGCLHQYIQKHKYLPEEDAQRIFRQLCIIMAFCHQLGIMIRDLKLRKLVFSDENCVNLRLVAPLELKVCDNPQDDSLTDRHGCPAYVSPEIVSLNATSYAGKPADMWSAGVLLYVMLAGKYPFYDSTATRLFEKIRKAEFRLPSSLDISLDARVIINSLLRLEPDRRPTALRMLRVAWIQEGAVKKMKELAPACSNPMRRIAEPDDQLVPEVSAAMRAQIQERLQNANTNVNTTATNANGTTIQNQMEVA